MVVGRESGCMAASVSILARVVVKHLHTAYAGLQKFLQQEWGFMQRLTPGIGAEFQPVEEVLCKAFLPALFKRDTSHISGRAVTGLIVK